MQSNTQGADSTPTAQTVHPREFAKKYGALTDERRAQLVKGLRELADFIEDTSAPLTQWINVDITTGEYDFYDEDREAWKHIDVKALRRLIGGRVHKEFSGEVLNLVRHFGNGGDESIVRLRWSLEREQVCEAKPVLDDDGNPVMQEVTKYGEYTDAERAAQLRAELSALAVKETVPVVEWDCKPILGADDAPEA